MNKELTDRELVVTIQETDEFIHIAVGGKTRRLVMLGLPFLGWRLRRGIQAAVAEYKTILAALSAVGRREGE